MCLTTHHAVSQRFLRTQTGLGDLMEPTESDPTLVVVNDVSTSCAVQPTLSRLLRGRLHGLCVGLLLLVILGACSSPSRAATSGKAARVPAPKASRVKARGPAPPLGIPGRWKLILNSTFSGRSLNTNIWNPGWFGTGTGATGPVNSKEAVCYGANNVTLPGDGTMHLRLSLQPSTCTTWGVTSAKPLTGALVSTNPYDGRVSGGFQYTYGVLEVRMYLPGYKGTLVNWPSVWAVGQGGATNGEDDIAEGLDGGVCFHFHTQRPEAGGGPGGCDENIRPGWHTFASNWEPHSVTYYYDGREVGKITKDITSAPEYIILANTTAGQSWNDPTRAAYVRVQYVRVWDAVRPPMTDRIYQLGS